MPAAEKDYEQLQKLGQGTYGVVYKVRDLRDNQLCALKKVRLPDAEGGFPATALREIAVLKALRHPNLVALRRFAFNAEKRKLYLFFEYVDCDLKAFVRANRVVFGMVVSFARQLLEGLRFLHSRRVMHRDVKSQNVLVDVGSGRLKIADFGLSRPFALPMGRLSREIQSLWYRAPEVLLGEDGYSLGVDVWSAGCVVAELLLRRPLFVSDSEFGMLVGIFELLGTPGPAHPLAALPFFSRSFPRFVPRATALWHSICGDSQLCELMERMLELNPDTRVTPAEALKLSLFDEG